MQIGRQTIGGKPRFNFFSIHGAMRRAATFTGPVADVQVAGTALLGFFHVSRLTLGSSGKSRSAATLMRRAAGGKTLGGARGHRRSAMDTYLLMITFRVWFFEIAVSGFNYFVLMNRIYEPRVGELRAHRIGMTTRIVYIFFPFAYALVRFADITSVSEMLLAGTYWLLMVLAFEWVGSFILRRPVHEILEGWHIERGYMWPYVLAAYFFSPLIVGLAVRAGS